MNPEGTQPSGAFDRSTKGHRMDDTLEQITRYLRGQKVPTRSEDSRTWADYLDRVIKPQLEELAELKAAREKKGKAA